LLFERFTEKARRVIFFARYEASSYGDPRISTEHLLLGLLREDKALFFRLWKEAETVESIRGEIEKHIQRRPKISTSVDLPLANDAKRVLSSASEEADRLDQKHIGTEHLLLGLLREENCVAAKILRSHGVELAKFRESVASSTVEASIRVRPYSALTRAMSRETVLIHGTQHHAETIRIRVVECRAFSWHWRQQKWASRDLAVERETGQISFDLSLAENTDAFHIAQNAWKYDSCAICRWRLDDSPELEHSVGYTNGRDWVCSECYEKFLKRSDYFRSAYQDLT
jgi:hypothetical protein